MKFEMTILLASIHVLTLQLLVSSQPTRLESKVVIVQLNVPLG